MFSFKNKTGKPVALLVALFIALSIVGTATIGTVAHAKTFADLDVQCKREKPPTKKMELNAYKMFLATKKIIEQKTKERRQQGRELEAIIVARAGTDPKKNILLADNPSGEEITLEQMVDEAQRRTEEKLRSQRSNRRNNPQIAKQIFEELFAEAKDSKRNIDYSHVGLLLKNDADPNGWSFVHLLSPCSSKKSRIYYEGIGTFFMDDPYAYKAWFMIPSDEIQKRIIDVVNNTTIPKQNTIEWTLMAPTYNLAASLNNVEEANSNTWPVYVLSAAIAGRTSNIDYYEANRLTKDLDFRPSKIILKGFHKLAMSSMAPKFVEIREEDHPYSQSFGVIEVLTALSINEFLKRNNVLDEDFEYILPPEETFK